MKTKHNVFVPVGSQQEAEMQHSVLKAIKQPIDKGWYFSEDKIQNGGLYLTDDETWYIATSFGNANPRTQITFGELIDLLSKPDFSAYLEEAKQKYPKGTKFKQMTSKEHIISSGQFELGDYGVTKAVYDKVNSHFVFRHDNKGIEWAEIATEKIAVKVENERERILVSEFFNPKYPYAFNKYPAFITNDHSGFYYSETKAEKDNYTIIPFQDFAKEHNIKVPLLISQDGVELFEGDEYWLVKLTNSDLNFIDHKGTLSARHDIFLYPETLKAFPTKESALKWIEEQKPKEVEVKLFHQGTKAIIEESNICIYQSTTGTCFRIAHSDIQAIAKAMEELK